MKRFKEGYLGSDKTIATHTMEDLHESEYFSDKTVLEADKLEVNEFVIINDWTFLMRVK